MAVVPLRLDLAMTTLSDELLPPSRAPVPEHSFAELLDQSFTQSPPVGLASADAPSPLEQAYQSAARDEFLAGRSSLRSLTESAPNDRAPAPQEAQRSANDAAPSPLDAGGRGPDAGPGTRSLDRGEAPETSAAAPEPATKNEPSRSAPSDPKPASKDSKPESAPAPSSTPGSSAAAAAPANAHAASAKDAAKPATKGAKQPASSVSAVERELTGALPLAHAAAKGAAAGAPVAKPAPTASSGEPAAPAAPKLAVKLKAAQPNATNANESAPHEPSAKRSNGKDAIAAARLAAIALSAAGAPLPVSVEPPKGAKAGDANGSTPGTPGGVQRAEAATAAKPDQAHLTVIDLRGAAHHDPVQPAPDASQAQQPASGKFHEVEVRLVQLDAGSRGGAPAKSDSLFVPARSDASSQLQQNWGTLMNQLVRGSGIVLRDGGSGEIRLVLKPEHLGSVRVRLEMNDNQLSGRIVVDNQNVRQLFQQNLDALYRAFQESGFGLASLDVSVSGGDRGEREKGRSSPLPQIPGIAAHDLERSVPNLIGAGDSLINLFV